MSGQIFRESLVTFADDMPLDAVAVMSNTYDLVFGEVDR
jgi:hypothetical protein